MVTDDPAAAATAVAGGPDPARGLTAAEVRDRADRGLRNVTTDDNRRTFADIVRANVLTRFNAILGALLLVVLATGEYHDALFGIVLVVNALVGIVQETRAMRTLDRLAVVSAPRARVVRDGAVAEIAIEDVVRDDVLDVSTGDQLPVDGTVLTEAGLEIDESLLTGESDPVAKEPGDRVLSGSFVIAGQGRFVATAVGDDAYAARLAREAKQFTVVHSELRAGTDSILKVATWVIVPVGILLLISQLRSSASISEALRSSVAGVGAIIPEGLVLLTSVAFAVGVIRLGRRQALIQELAAVEVLARVDVVCVDKTGTLTQGTLRVSGIEMVSDMGRDEVVAVLGALVARRGAPERQPAGHRRRGPRPAVDRGPRRCRSRPPASGAAPRSPAAGRGCWARPTCSSTAAIPCGGGSRRWPRPAPGSSSWPAPTRRSASVRRPALAPVALVCLEEQIRPEAADTVAYFRQQGVAVKVISGDHPVTVGAVAADGRHPRGRRAGRRPQPARRPRRARQGPRRLVGVRTGAAPPEAGDGAGAAAPGPRRGHDRRRRQRRPRPQGGRHGRGHGVGERRHPQRRPAGAARRLLRLPARGGGRGPAGDRQRRAGGQPVRHQVGVRRPAGPRRRVHDAAVPLLPPAPHDHLQPHHRHPGLLPGPGAQRPPQPAGVRVAGGALRRPRRHGGRGGHLLRLRHRRPGGGRVAGRRSAPAP